MHGSCHALLQEVSLLLIFILLMNKIEGGTVYVATGNINFEDCTFEVDFSFYFSPPSFSQNQPYLFRYLVIKFLKDFFKDSKALEAGGIIYVVSLSSVQFARSAFVSYDSPSGAIIYAESLYNQSITLDTMMMDFYTDTAVNLEAALVEVSSGTLNVVNSHFSYIKQSMFRIKGTTAIFDNNYFDYIDCTTQISSFCLISAVSSSLYFRNSQLNFYSLNKDMFLLHACKEVVFDNVHMEKIYFSPYVPVTDQTVQLFLLRIQSTPSVTIKNSFLSFMNMTSGMRAKKSNINISSTAFVFDNEQVNTPVIETPEELELGPGKSKILVLESCNSSISDSSLEGNVLGTESNGSVKLSCVGMCLI